MKRALKIIGWTLLGIVLTVVLVACIAIYLVFTPERLTPIARQAAAKYITCEHEIGTVDLTFFSTFPRFGFRMDGLTLINPKAGAQNDTVLAADLMTATVDVMEFLRNRNMHLHEAVMDNARVNFYIAPDGTNSLTGVIVMPWESNEEDTAAFALPFDELRVDGMRMTAKYITYVDDQDTLLASMGQTEMSMRVENWDDMLLTLDAHDVCARIVNDTYANGLHVEMIAPMAADLPTRHIAFDGARLALNDFNFRMDGTVDLLYKIALDLQLSTDIWQIEPLFAIIPAHFTRSLTDLTLDGKMRLDAKVKGMFGGGFMPHIHAHVLLKEGTGSYATLPYTLRNMDMDADVALLMNADEQSAVRINSFSALTKESAIAMKGRIDDLFGDMGLNLALKIDANLPDFAYFMPEDMTLTGHAKGDVNLKMRLEDLTELRLEKGVLDADLQMTDIHYAKDSMTAALPRSHVRLQMPNRKPSKPRVKWARVDLETDQADLFMPMPLQTAVKASTIRVEAGNMLSDNPVIYAAVALKSAQPMEVTMDSSATTIMAPDLNAYVEYNTQDTTVTPVVEATLNCQEFDGWFKETKGNLKNARLEGSLSGGRKEKSIPVLHAKLNTQAAELQMGKDLSAKTGVLAIEAGARYKADEENIMLQWNPRLDVNLKNGELNIPDRLPETVRIPSIEFVYSNREMNIENSRIELGHSDLNLTGNVRNMGKWFRHDTVLVGELDVVSDHCDANQLLAWFSADSGSEEKPAPEKAQPAKQSEPAQTAEQPETEPFLVPTDVDLALNTHIREVEIFEQLAKDLKGGLYVKEGKLILDEVGFVCHAAKLQLTAIYRSPRRNHLYVGLDYHMLDVNVDELLAMIPNLNEMVPMLSSFKGYAQFHLAAETYLNSKYEPKMSTLRGADSLSGKNMVVLDGETFTKISKLLMFNKKTENVIDSINAEITVYKNEIDIYPLCVSMDNYMVALGGRHKTDMTFDYDINVLKPIYLGVHVGGTMDDLQIKLAKCKFAKDFRPHWYQKADSQSMELRRMIKASMEKNVRIKSDRQ